MRIVLVPLAASLIACGGSSVDSQEPSEVEAAPDEASAEEAAPALLAEGATAPDVSLFDQSGATRTIAEHRGHPVVLYFYPRDATPGCTAEACAFRDAWDRLQASGAVVYGVSTDDVDSHRAFAEEHALPFSLLADTEAEAARAYGVPMHGDFVSRVTFVIAPDGTVARVFPDVDPAVHAEEILEVLSALPAPG